MSILAVTTLSASIDRTSIGKHFVAAQQCRRPRLDRHTLARQSADLSTLKFRCRRGWNLVGDSTVVCKRGRWHGDVPVCVSSRCRPLSPFEHGTLTVQYGGGIVGISCERGYTLEGAQTLACDGYKWNATAPKCSDLRMRASRDRRHKGIKTHEEWLSESDYSCASPDQHVAPPRVQNAVYFTKWAISGDSARLYTVYRCRRGHLAGYNKMYCQAGRWRGKKPTCEVPDDMKTSAEVQRDQPPPKQNVMSHERWLRLSDYTCLGRRTSRSVAPSVPGAIKAMRYTTLDRKPRLYAQYTCRRGYHLSVSAQRYMYCRKHRWIGRQPSCIKDEQGSDTEQKEVENQQKKTPKLPLHSQGTERSTPEEVGSYSGKSWRPCAVNNGNCEHKCSEYRGKAKCLCRPGYILRRDRRTCKDVNNCARDNGGCSQICVNTPGSYQCRCRPGFRLLPDGRACVRPTRRRYRPAKGRKQIRMGPRESTALASNGY
ncbi:hypothetical protein NP493_130g01008 [Ridgeia piscesae]|uniref:Sushi domain-containing protein n=1 Tax=Ridgeia piscesae TaxID=27915 RepID=A0AAD9P5Q1_RIDPI|nr:hypothetical protein NP493_130g01008 [Ridgeia piscesae]